MFMRGEYLLFACSLIFCKPCTFFWLLVRVFVSTEELYYRRKRIHNFQQSVLLTFDFLVSTSWKIDAVILPFLTLYHNGFSCCPLVRISNSLTTDEGHKSSILPDFMISSIQIQMLWFQMYWPPHNLWHSNRYIHLVVYQILLNLYSLLIWHTTFRKKT